MSNVQIDFQGVLQLVELIKSSSNFSEIRLRSGGIEIELRRGGGAVLSTEGTGRPAKEPALQLTAPSSAMNASSLPPAATRDQLTQRVAHDGEVVIRSPMVGTVYHAPEPGAEPFVKIGQKVGPADQLCIVEVMKLMNSIHADCQGQVTEILVDDGQPVAHGQDLFVISTR